jgi:hypothetical protein
MALYLDGELWHFEIIVSMKKSNFTCKCLNSRIGTVEFKPFKENLIPDEFLHIWVCRDTLAFFCCVHKNTKARGVEHSPSVPCGCWV